MKDTKDTNAIAAVRQSQRAIASGQRGGVKVSRSPLESSPGFKSSEGESADVHGDDWDGDEVARFGYDSKRES